MLLDCVLTQKKNQDLPSNLLSVPPPEQQNENLEDTSMQLEQNLDDYDNGKNEDDNFSIQHPSHP